MVNIKILLLSNYNPFSLSLIARLDKEGHQVFVITGSQKKNKRKPRNVFQEYRFTYDSKNLPYIINNIGPDLAIFNGELDSFSDYIAGITNIMISLKEISIRQFVYISSLSVFKGNSEIAINENTKAYPIDSRDKTILMGEKICKEYSKDLDFKVNILRFSQIYGSYDNYYLEDNICTEICKKAIKNEEIEIIQNKRHNLLYLDDAVDALYKVINNKGKKYEIYHIAAEEKDSYLEAEIAEVLKDKLAKNRDLKTIKNNKSLVNKRYSTGKIKKLKFNIKYKLEDKIGELYEAIRKDERAPILIDSQRDSILARVFKIDSKVKDKIFPYIENLGFFILLNIFIYLTRSMNFHRVIDLYLIYTIIISLIYGYEQSVFTIILSVIAKVYITIYSDIEVLSLVNEFMYMWILSIFGIGVLVGYLKEQYKIKYTDMTDENKFLEKQLEDIKEINKSNAEIKELYEKRLLNYRDSFGKIHEVVSELDLVEPKAIIFKALRVIENIMNTRDVSIYISSGNTNFFRLAASSSKKTKKLKASLKTSEYISIFEKMEKKEIYVNGSLDPNYPIMAGGTYKNDNLQSIIMIWSLPFESNNLYQMNIFGVLCKLIESSLNVAYEYMSNISRSYELRYENMLDEKSFKNILELYQLGSQEGIVEFSLLRIKRNLNMTREEFIDGIKKNIRETDYINEKEDYTNILLANTNKEESQYVIDRLKNSRIIIEEGDLIG